MSVNINAKDYTEKIIESNGCPKCKSVNIVFGSSRYICKKCFNCFANPIKVNVKYGLNMSKFNDLLEFTPIRLNREADPFALKAVQNFNAAVAPYYG